MTMRRLPLHGLIVAALLLGVSACGGSGTVVKVADTGHALHLESVAPTGRDAFHTLLRSARDLGPLPSGQRVSLVLVLRDETATRRSSDLASMYSPSSSDFGHFQSLEQYAARYGPSGATVHRVRSWLSAHGLRSTWQRGDAWLTAAGPAKAVERAFGVTIHRYRAADGARFYAAPVDPAVPRGLRGDVTGVGRISSYLHLVRYAVPAGGLAPADLLKAYDIEPLRKLGLDGAGQTVAFFELDGYAQKDLDAFTSKYNLPPIHPIIKGGPRLSKVEGETEMDLEVVHEIAPRARLVLYNIDWSAVTSAASSFPDLGSRLAPLQQKMVNENGGGVISESWGACDSLLGQPVSQVYRGIYDKADLLGESVFASTGDSGGYECLMGKNPDTPPSPGSIGIPLPSAAPGVTAVGGTRLSVRENGGWYREEVWEEPPMTEGTGGGVSAYLPLPSWQKSVWSRAQNPAGRRQTPDVAADADPSTGAAVYIGGDWSEGGGTSQSAPIWAGITVLMNQYLATKGRHHLGFMNPSLYALAKRQLPHAAFHDVSVGTNLVYPAGIGYDMASGLGTPDAWNLARDLQRYLQGSKRRQ